MTIYILAVSSGCPINVFTDEDLANAHCEAYIKNTGCFAWVNEMEVTTGQPQIL